MLHGDNRVLTCGSGRCPNISGDEVIEFDNRFLAGEDVPCRFCAAKREYPSLCMHTPSSSVQLCSMTGNAEQQAGKRVRSLVHYLRPAVLLDENIDLEVQIGELYDLLIQVVKECDLLLIVGTSMRTNATSSLVQDLAGTIHQYDGVVVYIDIAELKPGRFKGYVDFHLKMDVHQCAIAVMEAMDKV
jgi:NAD-dependent SIR2 family protein deacetylase